jgi:hypothetical protein
VVPATNHIIILNKKDSKNQRKAVLAGRGEINWALQGVINNLFNHFIDYLVRSLKI